VHRRSEASQVRRWPELLRDGHYGSCLKYLIFLAPAEQQHGPAVLFAQCPEVSQDQQLLCLQPCNWRQVAFLTGSHWHVVVQTCYQRSCSWSV
jgi:hypothetical protein